MDAAVAGDPLGLLGSLLAGGRPGVTELYIGPRLVHAVTAPELVRAYSIVPRLIASPFLNLTRPLIAARSDLAPHPKLIAESISAPSSTIRRSSEFHFMRRTNCLRTRTSKRAFKLR